jgi:hypothetical protein
MDNSGRPRRRFAAAGPLLPWLLPLALAGCSTPAPERVVPDPYLGKPPAPVRTAAASGPAGEPAVPYPPAFATSPAALAAGVKQPFDADRDLRIASADPNNPAAKPPSDPAWKGRPGAGDPTPAKADPFPPGGTADPRSAIVPVSLSAARIANSDQAFAYLAAHGAVGFQLQACGDTGEFACRFSIPNRQNPSLFRTYEARAHDPLAALRSAIGQMEKEQSR